MELNRKPDESVYEYRIRLCKNKDILGLSWQEIAKIINKEDNTDYSSSKYRKWWAVFKEATEFLQSKNIGYESQLVELEHKRIEVEKEKIKLSDQRREYNKFIRETARDDALRNLIHDAVTRLPLLQWKMPLLNQDKKNNRESVLCLADWHVGMFTNNYWNKFNSEELHKRVELLSNRSIEYNLINDVDTVHIFLMGDMIHGLLRPTNRIQSTENVVEQTIHAAELLSTVLTKYANTFPTVKIYSVLGNHGRSIPKKEDSITGENYDKLITWYLQSRLSSIYNVNFVENSYDVDIINANVSGNIIYGVHGDKDKMSNVSQNLTLMTGIKPKYIYMGHLHKYQRDEFHGVKVILSPSLCGTDNFAKDSRLSSDAAQILSIFDSNGEVCTYYIPLDEVPSSLKDNSSIKDKPNISIGYDTSGITA